MRFQWHIGTWVYTLFQDIILFVSYGPVLSNASKMHLQILVSSRKLELFFLVVFIRFTRNLTAYPQNQILPAMFALKLESKAA